MNCQQCGKRKDSGANFCQSCGASLSTMEAGNGSINTRQETDIEKSSFLSEATSENNAVLSESLTSLNESGTKSRKANKKMVILIGSAAIFILGLLFVYLLTSSREYANNLLSYDKTIIEDIDGFTSILTNVSNDLAVGNPNRLRKSVESINFFVLDLQLIEGRLKWQDPPFMHKDDHDKYIQSLDKIISSMETVGNSLDRMSSYEKILSLTERDQTQIKQSLSNSMVDMKNSYNALSEISSKFKK
ncbi:MAG: hypothetical protein ACYDEX_25305 [Mobilitalea sp.]